MSRFIHVADEHRLHVEEHGGGLPIFLLHGFTGGIAAWGDVIPELAQNFRVVAVDLIGHGQSSRPILPERYAMDAVIDDLIRVLDNLAIERAVWVGYSMGARVALAAATRHPERIQGLVLEGGSPGLEDESQRRARRTADATVATLLEQEGIERFVEYWSELPIFATQQALPKELQEQQRARRLQNSPAALAACLRGLGTGSQPSYWPDLLALRVPTRLIVGAKDEKFQEIAARMQRALRDADTRTIPGAGHTTHLENRKLYVETVREFCEQRSPQA